jgi:hypothetical protein
MLTASFWLPRCSSDHHERLGGILAIDELIAVKVQQP